MPLPEIIVNITDRSGAIVEAKLIDFQTISRVYPADQSNGEGMKQEGIIFGICMTTDGHFYARRLHEMRAVNAVQDSYPANI